MNLEEFIEHFAEQFDDTATEVFNPKTEFKELDEWNSLIALSIISMVDEEYEVTVGGADIRNAKTIEDLFKIVERKK